MFNDPGIPDDTALSERNFLRSEAMALFERCLTEGSCQFLETFVEEQISQNPPRLELLREVADDLHQRLLSLRENHFAVREHVLRTVHDDFSVDLSPLVPPHALDSYHLLRTDDALGFLRQHQDNLDAEAEDTLRKTLEASLQVAAQLYHDVIMTEQLYEYVMDWIMALNSVAARCYRADPHFDGGSECIH